MHSSASKSNPPLLLDFLLPLLRFKVQSSAISRSFWTFSCLSSASKSNPPLLLAPFGLPPASSPLQSPILRSFSLLLDFLLPLLHLKVHSAALFRSFWTSSCVSSTSKSIPPLFFAPFGLPPASPPLQSPILLSFSPFGLPPASPPLQGPILHAPAPLHAKNADCKAIRQSQSANSNSPVSINQSNPPSANSTK